METVKVNEDSDFTYPEVIDGISEWIGTDEPDRPITVSANGLKSLLRLVDDCWPVVAGMTLSRRILEGMDAGPYAEAMEPKNLADLTNRLSAVWCEGDLIVSGLFVDGQGRVLINTIDGDEPVTTSNAGAFPHPRRTE